MVVALDLSGLDYRFFFAFNIKPACDSTEPNHVKAKQFQHMILQIIGCSRQNADPATPVQQLPKSSPFKEASRLQLFIGHRSTAENKRGLGTHPCFKAEVMGKLRLDPTCHALLLIGPHTVSTASISSDLKGLSTHGIPKGRQMHVDKN